MSLFLLEYEAVIRLGFFFSIFITVALWEIASPKRPLMISKLLRWYSNLLIVVINSLVTRWAFPILAVGIAMEASKRGWGLFNNFSIPEILIWIFSLVILDFAIYLQHLMFHAVPLLWRIHRMHHADLEIDVTTGARFHPLEIMLSMLFKLSVIVVIGPPAVSVLIFEIILNGTAMFNHGNINLPLKLDRFLRLLIVTPDMHRVHHSVILSETNSNYGFNLPWWDRLLGTYRAQPQEGHKNMTIGIEEFRNPKFLHLHWLTLQPFISGKSKNQTLPSEAS